MTTAAHSSLNTLPAAESSRLNDFERLDIVTLESFPPQFVLVVSGTKPFINMDVDLVPLTYVRQPEYWGIEVAGRLPSGIGVGASAPYTVSLPLTGIIGTKGIEVIGVTRSERRDLDHEPSGPAPVEPDVIWLRGDDVQLTFSRVGGPANRQLRCFRDADQERTFSGAEIRVQQTDIGQLVTVGLSKRPDEALVKLTLVPPLVNVANANETPVETHVVVSTHRDAAFVPQLSDGQLVTSRVMALSATGRRETTVPVE